MQRFTLSTWRWPAALLALSLALVMLMSWGELTSQPVAANDASVDFSMNVVSGGTAAGGAGCSTNDDPAPTAKGAAVCRVALGGSFVVEVQAKDIGIVGTDTFYPGAYEVHTAMGWTAGLMGPGDAGSAKAVSVVSCPGTSATEAPFLDQPQTAAASCEAAGMFSEPEAEGVIGRYELNCGSSTSQELVTMILAEPKGDGTHIVWWNGSIADANSSEVITIECGEPAPTPTPTPTATPTQTPTPLLGDVNCNDVVDSVDPLLILQFLASLLESLSCESGADVDENGVIDSRDALIILQFIAGLIGTLPP